ncbi:MAG: hypothetical protein M3Z49_08530, partial [Bifidobacteriales bacterium]|nr:hypothetical protein [Bifidobacteriales bacterium]
DRPMPRQSARSSWSASPSPDQARSAGLVPSGSDRRTCPASHGFPRGEGLQLIAIARWRSWR